ncbi:hypothetical protein BCR36DRAFT_370800 [Piromyces finnis]|uniref:DUF4219 domain-containing protein n=1 Tax=Piromyces finnis TaxID=1754191 RepID=A0A1Y1V7L8_9FUNG|nr:hypothetical protein BCR36DRAFT_370800 [Piromyces finnis]|eukprot:ORX49229.1 hypothetical protein BCR36DRAFT_370800 [Piromyces finnis]
MFSSYKVDTNQLLNETNYENWKVRILGFLNAQGLIEYAENDVVANITKIKGVTNEVLKEAKKKENIAKIIIICNISDKALEKVRDLKTPYEIMKALKKEYDKSNFNKSTYWINKLENLKTNSICEYTDTFSNINEKNFILKKIERIKYIFATIPKEIRNRMTIPGREDIYEFMDSIEEQILSFLYEKRRSLGIDHGQGKEEKFDMMDIDSIKIFKPTHGKKQEFKNKDRRVKNKEIYCSICHKYRHSTEMCRYNLKYYFNTKYRKGRYHKSYKMNKPTYISNVEYNLSSLKETNICLDNIRPMFEKCTENVDPFKSIKSSITNGIEQNSKNDNDFTKKGVWIKSVL